MKTILEFEFDEEEAHDDELYRRITRVDDITSALYLIHKEFSDAITDETEKMLHVSQILAVINKHLEYNNVNLEDIYS